MNVRYRVALTQDERDELGALLSGGKAARKLKRAQICWRPTRASATTRLPPASGSAARRFTGPSGGSWRAAWRGR